jgi:AcrR family transcriptional regulator
MDTNPLDRRVRRTRHALEQALISLILEKGYDSVTIEDITNRADLGRTTFYLHYRDKEDLLMQTIDSIAEDFLEHHEAVLGQFESPKSAINKLKLNLDKRVINHIFLHARENADLYKVMLRGEGGVKASHRLVDLIKDETIKRLKSIKELEFDVPIEVISVFFAGTLVELIKWWLEEEQPYEIEEMVKYFQQMFFLGARGTLKQGEFIGNDPANLLDLTP